jgi:hypothetical protein
MCFNQENGFRNEETNSGVIVMCCNSIYGLLQVMFLSDRFYLLLFAENVIVS